MSASLVLHKLKIRFHTLGRVLISPALNGLFVKNVTMICQPIVLFGFTIDNKDNKEENVKNVAIVLQAIVLLTFTIC